jgi:hypothetical protein
MFFLTHGPYNLRYVSNKAVYIICMCMCIYIYTMCICVYVHIIMYIYSSIRLYNCTYDYNRLHVYPRNMPVCEKHTHPHTHKWAKCDTKTGEEMVFLWLNMSGWWFQPLWKMLVSWDDYSQYMVKQKMFQTTKQKTNKHWIDHWCPAVNHTFHAKNLLVSMALTMALGGLPCLASRTYSWFCQWDKQGLRPLYIIYIKSGVQYFLQYSTGESPSI